MADRGSTWFVLGLTVGAGLGMVMPPTQVGAMAPGDREALGAHIDHAYRVIFLVIAVFTLTGH